MECQINNYVYLIGVIYPYGELNIMGIYTEEKILIDAYNILMEKDARCKALKSPDMPEIYKIPLNKFLGERVDWAEIEGEPYFYEMDNIEKVSIEELKEMESKNDKHLEELYEMDLQLSKINEMPENDKEKFMLQVKEKMNSLDLDLNCDEMDADDKEFLEAAALFYTNNKEAYERDVKSKKEKSL